MPTFVENRKTATSPSTRFLTYVRTLSIFQQRLRLSEISNDCYVHVPLKTIEKDFFSYPKYNAKNELKKLKEAGKLKIIERQLNTYKKAFYYKCLTTGSIDISLIKRSDKNYDELLKGIRSMLYWVKLKPNSPTTEYFDVFLKHKHDYMGLFFTVDDFSGRIHTPVSNLKKEYRKKILLAGLPVVSFDVAQMQPLLLARILQEKIGNNEFSNWINSGLDIYTTIQQKLNYKTREEGKKRFFEILFAQPSNDLEQMFGNSEWIRRINSFKRKIITQNPHSKEKPHSNLAWLLQNYEVKLMRKVWQSLYVEKILFLTVHDEILIQQPLSHKGEVLFRNVLDGEFNNYRLNKEKY